MLGNIWPWTKRSKWSHWICYFLKPYGTTEYSRSL